MGEIIFSICVTAAAASLFRVLIPNERFGTQVKLLISCFFIVTVIGIFRGTSFIDGFGKSISTDAAYNDYTSEINRMTAKRAAENVEIAVKEKLYEIGIIADKIIIDVNISDIGCISINGIKLFFSEENYYVNSEKAIRLIEKLTDNKVRVIAEVAAE